MQIIISKDERISGLEQQISKLDRKHKISSSNEIHNLRANLTAKINVAESRALHAEEQTRISIRAERAVTSHRISVLKKESSDRCQNLTAIADATKDKMGAEKEKTKSLTRRVNQQISTVREKGKEAAIARLELACHEKRMSKECHAAAEVATKRQKTLVQESDQDRISNLKTTLKNSLGSINDLQAELTKMRLNEEQQREQIVTLQSDCAEAIEEIIVSAFYYFIFCILTLVNTSNIICCRNINHD